MFKIKTIDFEKIRAMVDAAERLVDADIVDKAEAVLIDLSNFINQKGKQ